MIFPGTPDGSEPADPTLPDGIVAISTRSWFDLILRMSVHPSLIATAAPLARHANPDGTRVFPGAAKVANMGGFSDPRARAWMKFLLDKKLLVVKKRGGGRPSRDGRKPPSTEYRLTRPADLTTLGLKLDPDFNPIPDGAGFVPLDPAELRSPAGAEEADGTGKHRAPAGGEKKRAPTKQRPPASADRDTAAAKPGSPVHDEGGPDTGDAPEQRSPASFEAAETPLAPGADTVQLRSPTSADGPVDNHTGEETPLVPTGNSARYDTKLRSPMGRDLDSTYNPDQNPSWLPQATASPVKLGASPSAETPAAGPVAERRRAPSIAAGFLDGTDASWIDSDTAYGELVEARRLVAGIQDREPWLTAGRDLLVAAGRQVTVASLAMVTAELWRRETGHQPTTSEGRS